MKVLIVCSINKGKIASFIDEQAEALTQKGVSICFYLIKGKGLLGYLKNLSGIINKIRIEKPDILHAHYGLSGLLAVLQWLKPVVITFHGSDVNNKKNRFLSRIATKLAKHIIVVNSHMVNPMNLKRNYSVVPCGVDLTKTYPINKRIAKKKLNLARRKKYILFSSSFNRPEKNPLLAKKALANFNIEIELVELKNLSREQVTLWLNAADAALLTSKTEGSPQFIKEAMACNCPVVSTNVGDVAWLFGNEPGYFLTSFEPDDVAEKLKHALEYSENFGITNGRSKIIELGLDSYSIANKIISLYEQVLHK